MILELINIKKIRQDVLREKNNGRRYISITNKIDGKSFKAMENHTIKKMKFLDAGDNFHRRLQRQN